MANQYTEEQFLELASNEIRKVATPEGAKFYGLPIGSPITADIIQKKKQEAAAQGKKAPKGGVAKVPAGSVESAGANSSSTSSDSGSDEGSSQSQATGLEVIPSTIKGPNAFKVGDAEYSAPSGSKLIRSKNNENIAYVLTPDGSVHAFNPSGEVPIPDYLSDVLSEKFKNLDSSDSLYSVESFDVKASKKLADFKPGTSLNKNGNTAFVKQDDGSWQNPDLGVVLADEDLQGAFDNGNFDVQEAHVSETDFSQMSEAELAAALESFEVGKKLAFGIGSPKAIITKNDDNMWTSSLTGKSLKGENIADLAVNSSMLSENIPDSPALPKKDDKKKSKKDQEQEDPLLDPEKEVNDANKQKQEALNDLAYGSEITYAAAGDVFYHDTLGEITYDEASDLWVSEKGAYSPDDVVESANQGHISKKPWTVEKTEEDAPSDSSESSNEEEVDWSNVSSEYEDVTPSTNTETATSVNEDDWESFAADYGDPVPESDDPVYDFAGGVVLKESELKSALDALESHSGFQIKYGLKSLPETHPLKDQVFVDALTQEAKDANPDLAPKKALVKFLKDQLPSQDNGDGFEPPLADWEKELLQGPLVQIGDANAKNTQTGLTGGSFTQDEIKTAIDILENFNGKIFKAELNKQGSPLGQLSPNDIVGFNKDKTITKQKFIDLLKSKLTSAETPEPDPDLNDLVEVPENDYDSNGIYGLSAEEVKNIYDDAKKLELDEFAAFPSGTSLWEASKGGITKWTKNDEGTWDAPEIDADGFSDADLWGFKYTVDVLGEKKEEPQPEIDYSLYTYAGDESDEPSDSEKTVESLSELQNAPTGTKMRVKHNGAVWIKQEDGNWYHAYDEEDGTGDITNSSEEFQAGVDAGNLIFMDQVTDTSEPEIPETPETAAPSFEKGHALSLEEMKSLPVGSVVTHAKTDVIYVLQEDGKWLDQKANYPVEVDNFGPATEFGFMLFDSTTGSNPETASDAPKLGVIEDYKSFTKLPIGTKIKFGTKASGSIYTKNNDGLWETSTNGNTWGDYAFKSGIEEKEFSVIELPGESSDNSADSKFVEGYKPTPDEVPELPVGTVLQWVGYAEEGTLYVKTADNQWNVVGDENSSGWGDNTIAQGAQKSNYVITKVAPPQGNSSHAPGSKVMSWDDVAVGEIIYFKSIFKTHETADVPNYQFEMLADGKLKNVSGGDVEIASAYDETLKAGKMFYSSANGSVTTDSQNDTEPSETVGPFGDTTTGLKPEDKITSYEDFLTFLPGAKVKQYSTVYTKQESGVYHSPSGMEVEESAFEGAIGMGSIYFVGYDEKPDPNKPLHNYKVDDTISSSSDLKKFKTGDAVASTAGGVFVKQEDKTWKSASTGTIYADNDFAPFIQKGKITYKGKYDSPSQDQVEEFNADNVQPGYEYKDMAELSAMPNGTRVDVDGQIYVKEGMWVRESDGVKHTSKWLSSGNKKVTHVGSSEEQNTSVAAVASPSAPVEDFDFSDKEALSNLPTISKEDFDALPIGARFVSEDGFYLYIKDGKDTAATIDQNGEASQGTKLSPNGFAAGFWKKLPDSPSGIAPGQYNSGKGAKTQLYVKPDGTGVFKGMKGAVKFLDAEGVKANFDAGMDKPYSPLFPDQFPDFAETPSAPKKAPAKKVIEGLGTVDDLPDGTFSGPLGATYVVSGDKVTISKSKKSASWTTQKVGQKPDTDFMNNAPAGAKIVFKLGKYSGSENYIKQEDGTWKPDGTDYYDSYLAYAGGNGYYAKYWKIESLGEVDEKSVTKESIKDKFLTGQLLDENGTSVLPKGYSGVLTFFEGPTDVSSLHMYRNYMADTSIPAGQKSNAHTTMGVPFNAKKFQAKSVESSGLSDEQVAALSPEDKIGLIVKELDAFLANTNVPEAQSPDSVFETDELGYVTMPAFMAAEDSPSYYDGTGAFTEYIKKLSAVVGDGSLVGQNMAGGTKDQKSDWISYFKQGNFSALYDLEVQVAKKKGKAHPTGAKHPGHPSNASTHSIVWGPAVKGEVPAGAEIPGNWTSTGSGLNPSLKEIDNYLIAAKMQNPTFLSNAEKRNWVTYHKNGNKGQVDKLSAKALLRKQDGQAPSSDAPVWTENLVPAKSYDHMFDDEEFPTTWEDYSNGQAAIDWFDDNLTNEPVLQNYFDDFYNNNYGYTNDSKKAAVQKFFSIKKEEYLEELNKPVYKVFKTISEGSHPTFIVKDQFDRMKIFKPLTPGKEWRAENEVAAHNLGSTFGFNVPKASISEVNEGLPMGTNNKGILMDFAPNVGSIGNVEGAPVDLKTLTPKQFAQIATEHVFDWFLDNDDTHDENLLISTDGNIVGIDKGRAFVQYGHWHGLDVDNPERLNVNTKDSPSGRKTVVYYEMIQAIKSGEISQEQLDEAYKQAIRAAKRLQKSDDGTVSAFVQSAMGNREDWGLPDYAQNWDFITPHPNNVDELVSSVLNRKNSLIEDFEEFYDKLYAAANMSKPVAPAKMLGDEHLSGWEEGDIIAKTEESKVWGAAPIHASAGFADGASLLWQEKDTTGNAVISGKIKLGGITQKKVMEFMASKIHPGSAVGSASTLKDYPTSHVKQWKKTVTAAAKDVSNNVTSGTFDQSLWDNMKATEAKVDTDLAFSESVNVADAGTTTFPSGLTIPNETVPQYVLALQYHKSLVANLEKAKKNQVATDKAHFQDFNPPAWKTKGTKVTSPDGAVFKELDDGNYIKTENGVSTIVPDLPDPAKSNAPGWTVEKDEKQEETAEKYSLISAGMFAGQLNENGEKILKSDFSTSGHPGKEYRIDLPTGEKVFFRDGDQTGTVLSQTGTVRFQLNRMIDAESSLANVQSYLEKTGIDFAGADEEQAESVYWRQMFGRLIGSDSSNAPKSVQEARKKLLAMKSELGKKVGYTLEDYEVPEAIGLTNDNERDFWHNLAIEAWGADKVNAFINEGKHMPQYQHMDISDPEKSTGLPYFNRIDVDFDALYKKGNMLAHGNNGKDDRHMDYIKSGAYTSTEERLRILGYYKTGASSSSDQGTGGANFVFTRVANGSALKTGAIYGEHVMYWSPAVMAMTGTYSYSHDDFGRLSSLQSGNKLNPLDSLSYTATGNETMVPHNISVLDFMEMMVFEDANKRQKAIDEFKKKGIETLRGLPIEDRLIMRKNLSTAMAKIKSNWKK